MGWEFIQDQVLGMNWLNELLSIRPSALGLDVNGRIGGSDQCFICDVLKITELLRVLIFAISYMQSYFPPERSKRILGRFHGIWANIISALLRTVDPFCSCSSILLFVGFTSAGPPLGLTFSFLISSPMVDLGSLVPAVPHHDPRGCEPQTAGTLDWRFSDWHYCCWLSVQCVMGLFHKKKKNKLLLWERLPTRKDGPGSGRNQSRITTISTKTYIKLRNAFGGV